MSINQCIVQGQGSCLQSVLWSQSGAAQCSQTGDMGHTPQELGKGRPWLHPIPTHPSFSAESSIPKHSADRSTDLPGNHSVECTSSQGRFVVCCQSMVPDLTNFYDGSEMLSRGHLLCAVQSVVTDLPLLRRLSKHPMSNRWLQI